MSDSNNDASMEAINEQAKSWMRFGAPGDMPPMLIRALALRTIERLRDYRTNSIATMADQVTLAKMLHHIYRAAHGEQAAPPVKVVHCVQEVP